MEERGNAWTTPERWQPALDTPFGDAAAWQAMLDRHCELFAEMSEGVRIGFVPRKDSGVLPGRHVEGLKSAASEVDMLAWELRQGRMRAQLRPYPGFEAAAVDLLLVADDEALAALHESLDGDAFEIIKRHIRRGTIMLYVLRTKHELQERGYEDFLDCLGLAFLGACR